MVNRKSQLAIEFALQVRERSPEVWLFWIHASNKARFQQGLRNIADAAKIQGRQDTNANMPKLVHDWLRDERKSRWILILDNVDDTDFLLPPQRDDSAGQTNHNAPRLIDCLPYSRNGSVLITSRHRLEARKLVEESSIVDVEPMQEPDAVKLLQRKLPKDSKPEEIATLASALEYMPLAMVRAASYISLNRPFCSIQSYLELFAQDDARKTSLLNHKAGGLRRDRGAKNSIILTWQISFDHIRKTRPSAADLLSLMCFCDRQGIPAILLRNRSPTAGQEELPNQDEVMSHDKNPSEDQPASNYRATSEGEPMNEEGKASEDDSVTKDEPMTGGKLTSSDEPKNQGSIEGASETTIKDESNGSADIEEDILILRDYALIKIVDASTYEMHRLVQLATRKWLQVHNEFEHWKEQFIKNLSSEMPNGDYENWAKCQQLYPHAKSALLQRPQATSSLLEWAELLYCAAWYAEGRCLFSEAEEMYKKAAETREKLLGRNHVQTLYCLEMLSRVYGQQWRLKEAEEIIVEVVERLTLAFGEDNEHTLISMQELAVIQCLQGRLKEAEELLSKIVETRKKTIGDTALNTLYSMGYLANIYYDQERYKEAEELNRAVLEAQEKVLGIEHPHTLVTMYNLALTNWYQNREEEALQMMERVVQLRSKVIGSQHPDTILSLEVLEEWRAERSQQDDKTENTALFSRSSLPEVNEEATGSVDDAVQDMEEARSTPSKTKHFSKMLASVRKRLPRRTHSPKDTASSSRRA